MPKVAGDKATTESPAIPAAVQVGPFAYEIQADEDAANRVSYEDACRLIGQSNPERQTITLRPSVASMCLRDTLLHEVLHAICSLTGVSKDLEDDEEEKAVNRIAPALLDVLRRNPALVEFLTS